MRLLILFTLLITCSYCEAQNKFIRVYDWDHHLLGKGRVVSLSDTALTLQNDVDGIFRVPVSEVFEIVTKRNGGLNIAMGALIGAGIGTLSGIVIQAGQETLGEEKSGIVGAGFGIGLLAGATVGALTIFIKNPHHIKVNGDYNVLRKYY